MTVLGESTETLLSGLSSFWQTMFAETDQLNALYTGTEELLGQAYLDLLTEVLNVNLQEMPLFNKEYWHLLTVREDVFHYDPTHDAPYYVDPPDPIVDAEFLFNRIYDPTWVGERGVDFVVEDQKVRFFTNVFEEELPGVATRRLPVEPKTRRQGVDGMYDVSDPLRLQVTGVVRSEVDGEIFENKVLRSISGEFSAADVGRYVLISGELDGAGAPKPFYIVSVLDASTVRLDSATSREDEDLRWEVYDDRVFYDHDTGEQIVISDPAVTGKEDTYTIQTVSGDGLSVLLDRSIELNPRSKFGIPWKHQSATQVTELAFWIPDALFDRENLYLSFGYLIKRHEPSTENYRALIRGIFQLFMRGPALSRIEAALNVMIGVPVVRTDGEVITDIRPDTITTDRGTYTIPEGSVRPELSIGTTLNAFAPLTRIFSIVDSVQDPSWFYGRRLPPEIVSSTHTLDRNIDAELYPSVVGSRTPKVWRIGDPRVFIGADFDGTVVEAPQGHDARIDPAAPRLWSRNTKFMDHHAGSDITVNGASYKILSVEGEDSTAVLDAPSEDLTALRTYSEEKQGIIPEDGQALFQVTGGDFKKGEDEGMYLEGTGSFTASEGWWVVLNVIDPETVRVAPVSADTNPTYPHLANIEIRKSLSWNLKTRPPLRHNLGFNVMRDYTHTHVCYVTYELDQYEIPFLRQQQDIRDVLLDAKPSHVYMMLAPTSTIESQAVVTQKDFILGIQPTEQFVEKEGVLTVGDDWAVGSYYQYANPALAWVDVVRDHEVGDIVELRGTSQASIAVLTPELTGAEAYVDVEIFAWTGDEFASTGESVSIGPGVSSELAEISLYGRMAVRVTAHDTTPDTLISVLYGLRLEDPGVVILDKYHSTRDTGEGVSAGRFRDEEFTFHTVDLWREIEVEIEGEALRTRVSSIVSPHEVVLELTSDGTTYEVPAGAHTWRLGMPHQVGTACVVGGSNPNIDRGTVRSWPVQVVFGDV